MYLVYLSYFVEQQNPINSKNLQNFFKNEHSEFKGIIISGTVMTLIFLNLDCVVFGVFSNQEEEEKEVESKENNSKPAYTNITVVVFICFMIFMAAFHCCLACYERRRISRNMTRVDPQEELESGYSAHNPRELPSSSELAPYHWTDTTLP